MTVSTAPAVDRSRARWLKLLHEWHWISSAICLAGMLVFAVTGFTLNHAAQIEAKPRVDSRTATAPAPVLDALRLAREQGGPKMKNGPLPATAAAWVAAQFGATAGDRQAEWSADEVYLSLPRPGGDAWLRIGMEDGESEYERTDRGWISYLNDLHKGRNTGAAWSWFIDIFAAGALVFCITGLLILKLHAANRALTWPVAGLGLVIPVLLALLFIH
ncbi:PepSY-associated TM helix domain-containing protein [Xylophilus sp. GOD-11R]|uniref:PepSY-associated TM helix domain-containing protein n=1 Tax=Xylophilus sp. GOD-11R TaxID=3089814 RepID=UPI00298D3EA7|nr:PepSY-associated TM helix domain-containing protein [Xylophilus sp. GOD-11R]WPB56099.1 PepSY-associated TM helix domain-containing protein [Xylophilus sp. GOD-11R]